MLTVGKGIFDLSPVMAAVVVWSHSFVLFIFSSVALESWLKSHGLPSFPLVPVSSSQAIVGAVIGIGLLKGGKSIRWKTVAGITSGWVTTPILAAIISLLSLYILQNVFQQETYRQVEFSLDNGAMVTLEEHGVTPNKLQSLQWKEYPNAVSFKKAVEELSAVNAEELDLVMGAAELDYLEVTRDKIKDIDSSLLTQEQQTALKSLEGRVFSHRWQLDTALVGLTPAFRRGQGEEKDAQIQGVLQQLYRTFRI